MLTMQGSFGSIQAVRTIHSSIHSAKHISNNSNNGNNRSIGAARTLAGAASKLDLQFCARQQCRQ